jgi:pSer/pThr/pTyr-binding forkhead associated (FHA) protein
MAAVTFQVLEGIDKGRVYRDLSTPVTIGREEGNVLRLNDERVSRFHVKIQSDNNEIILTDLDSTNGTRVNGNVVQIRRLRAGDRVHVGRSILLFGSESEIRARVETLAGTGTGATPPGVATRFQPATVPSPTLASGIEGELDFDLRPTDQVTSSGGNLFINNRPLPLLPQKLTPSQAARLSEILDCLHRHLIAATETTRFNEETSQVTLTIADWQRILGVQMLLARYVRAVSDPDSLDR